MRILHIRNVEGDEVGVPDCLVDGADPTDGKGLEGFIGDKRVIGLDVHLQAAGKLREPAGDPAEPDKAQCLCLELEGAVAELLHEPRQRAGDGEFPLSQGLLCAVEVLRAVHHRPEGMLGNGVGIGPGRVDHLDPQACGGGDVDVVQTDPVPADNLELSACFHDGDGEVGAADEKGVGIADEGKKIGIGGRRGDNDLRRLFQHFDPHRRDLLSQKYLKFQWPVSFSVLSGLRWPNRNHQSEILHSICIVIHFPEGGCQGFFFRK